MQKNTNVVRTPGAVARVICGVALAGACMIAPVSALAATSSAADAPASAASSSSSAALDDAQKVSFGGITFQVPNDWMTLEIGDTMSVSTSPDTLISASIIVTDVDGLPTDESGMLSYAGSASADAAKGMSADSSDAQAITLSDGTQAYAYGLKLKDGGTTTTMMVTLVPMGGDKLGVVTLSCEDGAKDGEDIADAISGTIALDDAKGTSKSTSATTSAALGQTVEAGGLKIDLPADMTGDDDPQAPTYVNADGTFLAIVFPAVADDVTELTTDVLDQAAVAVAQSLKGEVVGSSEVTLDETTAYPYAFVFDNEGTPMLGGITFVPVADGSLTAVVTACAAEDGATYGPVMDEIIASFKLA